MITARGIANSGLYLGILGIVISLTLSGAGWAERATLPPDIAVRARRISREVSAIRGLALREPLCVRVGSKNALSTVLRQRVRSEYGGEELLREGQLLGLLGLVENPDTYEEQVYALLESGMSGFYEPGERCLYLANWIAPDELTATLYHESAHALQDQHFDLQELLRHVSSESDRAQAVAAVTEGDATAVEIAATSERPWTSPIWPREIGSSVLAFFLEQGMQGPGRQLKAHLGRTFAFSYGDGLSLVQRRFWDGGWEEVDALLREPPISTEAVLHPESARASLVPVEVRLSRPPSLEGTCRLVHQDTLGELVLRSMLDRWLPTPLATSAVEGWGGDRALLFEGCTTPGQRTLVVATTWDEVAASERFANALEGALELRHGDPPEGRGSAQMFPNGNGLCSLLSRAGSTVVYLESTSCTTGQAVLAEIHGNLIGQGSNLL